MGKHIKICGFKIYSNNSGNAYLVSSTFKNYVTVNFLSLVLYHKVYVVPNVPNKLLKCGSIRLKSF